uniref:Uncharacterized protein n=1 Tax=Sphaerodactylus townsendi TaxID=933632 RepID=A0ACB8EH83_9SAUR
MQAESGIVPDFDVGEEFHEEPKTYYELKSQPLKNSERAGQASRILDHRVSIMRNCSVPSPRVVVSMNVLI